MSAVETIERLTDIIRRQAAIIQGLSGAVEQLNAVTSLESEMAAVQENIQKYCPEE